MKINVFEGARRITKLIAVIWVLGWCYYLAFDFDWSSPTVDAYFQVSSPGSAPIKMDAQKCDTNDAEESFYSKYTSKGTRFSGALCFKSEVFDNGRKLIPIFIMTPRQELEMYRRLDGEITREELIKYAKAARELGDEKLELIILEKLDKMPQELPKEQKQRAVTATKEELGLALQKAHEAGDTNDAKILAKAYADAREEANKQLKKVTDPAILAQLNGEQPAQAQKAQQESAQKPWEKYANAAADEHKLQVRGFEKYSTEVSSYTKKVAENFKLSQEDENWIDRKLWPARLKEIKEGSLWIIGGVACLYIFTWCVGWIIRGFAGIPLGHDRKPDDT